MTRINELDGLRAIAILGVFLTHFTVAHSRLSSLLYLGWAGVDLFFAISGFLITSILLGLREHEAPFKTFYGRRTLRIFPPYYLVLTLVLVLAFLHHEPVPLGTKLRCYLFLESIKLAPIELAAARLLFDYRPILAHQHFIPHFYILDFKDGLAIYWSLSVEEIFYLIWAPLILKGTRGRILLCSVATLLLCPVLRGLAHTPGCDEMIGVVFRFDSLVAGGCVALMFLGVKQKSAQQRHVDRALVFTMVFSGLALLLLSGAGGVFRGVDVRTTLSFSVLGFSLLAFLCASMVGACARWSGNRQLALRLLRSRPAVFLGTISYMMYLIHLPVYCLIQFMILRSLGQNAFETDRGLVSLCGVLAVVCTVFLAALSWRYFETPILRLKDKRFAIRTSPKAAPVMQTVPV